MEKVIVPTDKQVAGFLGQCGMEQEEIDDMLKVWEYMDDGPSSSKYHHVYANGLKMHVWEMVGLAPEWYRLHERFFGQSLPFTLQSLVKVIFCHDLHKVGQYELKLKNVTAKELESCLDGQGGVVDEKAIEKGFVYVDNKWKRPSDAIQKYNSHQAEYYMAQGESIWRAQVELGMTFTKEEAQAIYCHMLSYDYGNKSIAVICPLTYFLSCLDMMSANVYDIVRQRGDVGGGEED